MDRPAPIKLAVVILVIAAAALATIALALHANTRGHQLDHELRQATLRHDCVAARPNTWDAAAKCARVP